MITMSIYNFTMCMVSAMIFPVAIYTLYKMIPMVKKELKEDNF